MQSRFSISIARGMIAALLMLAGLFALAGSAAAHHGPEHAAVLSPGVFGQVLEVTGAALPGVLVGALLLMGLTRSRETFTRAAPLLLLAVVAFVGVASGQVDLVDAIADDAVEVPSTIETLLLTWLPRGVMGCGILATIFPSTNKVMRLIDLFALNWAKARSDPKSQKWGEAK